MAVRFFTPKSIFYGISLIFVMTGCSKEKFDDLPVLSFGYTYGRSIHEGSYAYSRINIFSTFSIQDTIKVSYDLSGDAILDEDFTISSHEFIIPPGETSSNIVANVISDSKDEFDEQFIVKLRTVETNNAIILDSLNEFFTEIRDDDRSDLNIYLRWDTGDGPWTTGHDPYVDMDLYLWRENPANSNKYELIESSITRGDPYTEFITGYLENIIISGLLPDGKYAVCCVLYHTEYDNVNFTLTYYPIEFATIDAERHKLIEFEGQLDKINLNQSEDSSTFKHVQYFIKDGFNFTNFSEIIIAEEGS